MAAAGISFATAASCGMAPAIKPGDRLHFDSNFGELQRGDIVQYNATFRDSPPQQMVHRVVALPGERLEPAPDGGVLINGQPLAEPYLPAATTTYLREPVDVPPDHVFLMGDNRERSSDSRVTGPIPRADVIFKLTKVDPANSDEDCGFTPADAEPEDEGPPPAVSENDPPALQLLTLPMVIHETANQDITADNLETVRTPVRAHTDRLEALLREAGDPARKAAHTVLRDEVIPALRSLLAAPTPGAWTSHRLALDAAMNHYLQSLEDEVLGDD